MIRSDADLKNGLRLNEIGLRQIDDGRAESYEGRRHTARIVGRPAIRGVCSPGA